MDKVHNNASDSEKVHLLLSSHIKIHQYISLELFQLVNSAWSVYFSPDSDDYFIGESNII